MDLPVIASMFCVDIDWASPHGCISTMWILKASQEFIIYDVQTYLFAWALFITVYGYQSKCFAKPETLESSTEVM